MGREIVRHWKRALHAPGQTRPSDAGTTTAPEAALNLLARSIQFGHGRLAVLRLVSAVKAGAQPSAAQWTYCGDAAETSRDTTLRELFQWARDASTTQARGRA